MHFNGKPKVITLCGSTKFKKQFEEANAALTLQGNIVLSLGFFEQSDNIEVTEEQLNSWNGFTFTRLICLMKFLSSMWMATLVTAQRERSNMPKDKAKW